MDHRGREVPRGRASVRIARLRRSVIAPGLMNRCLAASLAAIAAAACTPQSSDESSAEKKYPTPELVPTGAVVAQIGSVTLTTDELEERISMQNPLVRTRLGDPKELRRFVEAEVRNELLAQVGWEKGYYDDPEVQRTLRRAVVRKLVSELVSDIDTQVDVTNDEIVELYKERESEYFRPERVRVGRIFLPAETEAAKAKARARMNRLADQVRARQKQGRRNAFDEAAREITGETGADRRSVDLGFITREEAEARIGEEAAKKLFEELTVGDVFVVPAEDGVAMLSKTGRRGEVRRSLESVKPTLVSTIRAQKRNELLESKIEALAEERGFSLKIDNLDQMVFGKVPSDDEEAPER